MSNTVNVVLRRLVRMPGLRRRLRFKGVSSLIGDAFSGCGGVRSIHGPPSCRSNISREIQKRDVVGAPWIVQEKARVLLIPPE